MAYVALSRARKLDDIYLLRLNPLKLYCDCQAIIEYNRLRKKYDSSIPMIDKYNLILSRFKANQKSNKDFDKSESTSKERNIDKLYNNNPESHESHANDNLNNNLNQRHEVKLMTTAAIQMLLFKRSYT